MALVLLLLAPIWPFYLVTTPEAHHDAIKEALHSLKIVVIKGERIILFISELENRLIEEYYRNVEENAVEEMDIDAYLVDLYPDIGTCD